VRFLIHNSISPAVVDGLREAGHDAVHVTEYQLASASDDDVIDRALYEDRIAVTYDLDFPRLLALRRKSKPSLIIFRRLRHPSDQLATLLPNLDSLQSALNDGCIAVLEADRIRVRDLPLGRWAQPSDET
jgi:predicted nuclease of predicted toxin-antitoxin system